MTPLSPISAAALPPVPRNRPSTDMEAAPVAPSGVATDPGQASDAPPAQPVAALPRGPLGAEGQAALTASRLEARPASEEARNERGLTEAEEAMVDELAARDREVRDHEEAHARVGGPYAGQPTYTFQLGPDGKRYAIGGAVSIDVAPVDGDPEATITKMEVVKAAALAPAEPSGADRRVAALADAQRLAAMAELTADRNAERRGDGSDRGAEALVSDLAGYLAKGPAARGEGFDLAA